MSGRAGRTGSGTARAADLGAEVPAVGLREPCPCGSGRRYKACHGRAAAQREPRWVRRPFEGLPDECDWVALREIVPAATAPLVLGAGAGEYAGREVTLATVLPMAWPALVRADGHVLLALQVAAGSGDPSRDAAEALLRALAAPPGAPVPPQGLPGPGPRLQDLLEPDQALRVTVSDGFEFWLDGGTELGGEEQASLERANAGVVPTRRLAGVPAAYWVSMGSKEFLRWVLPYDEDPLLDALARLHVAGADGMGAGTRFVGSFRALGLLVPVWELAVGTGADALEAPAAAFQARLQEALADRSPLTAAERGARQGLRTRQLTLR